MFIRNAWYIAAWADEIGETPLAQRIGNEPVVLYRDRQGQAAALLDSICAAIVARRCTWAEWSIADWNAAITG
jgi:hypothetical protein